jgi:hypothetical protein
LLPKKEGKMLYLIHWRSLKTGATGHGTKAFPKDQAESICDGLNKQDKGLLIHWIAAEHGVESDEGDSADEEEFTNPYLLSGEELDRTEALRRSR